MKKLLFRLFTLFFIHTALYGASQGTVTGTVTDNSNNPLNNALITIYKNQQIHATTITDVNGQYIITTTPNNKYVIVATLNGYQTQSQGLIIQKDQTTVANFTLQPNPGSINVHTQDESLANLSGVTVSIIQNNVVIAQGTSNASGDISFTTLASGSYTVRGELANYTTTIQQAIVYSNQITNVTLTMSQDHGSLSGNVKGDGINLENALIELLQNDLLIASTTTDALGDYTIQLIDPGTYSVHAYADGFHSGIQGATINSNTTTTINFQLTSTQGSLQGNIQSSEGGNLAGVTVEVNLNNVIITSQLTDYYGNYQITGLTPNSYIIHAHEPGYQNGVQGAVINDGETTTLNFILSPDPCNLSGTVQDETLTPLAGVNVEVNLNNVILFSTLTDIDGNYLIQGITPGSYVLHAHDADYESGIVSKDLSSGNNTQNFTLQSTSTYSLQGTVKDELGDPIAGSIIELNANNAVLFSAVSAADGTYTFGNIPSGNYVIHCHKKFFQTGIGAVAISGSSQTYDFVLKCCPSTVFGYVQEKGTGSGISSAYLVLYLNNTFLSTAVSGANGYYELTGLPPGSYNLTTSCVGYFPIQTSFDLGYFTKKQINLALYSSASAQNGKAILSLNRFALQTQRVYSLSWEKPASSSVAGYIIYRNAQKIAFLPTPNILQYQDKTPPNLLIPVYKIVSVNANNQPLGVLNIFP